tara:strand:+ start:1801 stop:2946 length:1146 start_codon:yes stop_codon:yes gene_type:complete
MDNPKKYTRLARTLANKKQDRSRIKDGAPLISELTEGVPVFRRILGRLVQFVKYNNKVYKTTLSEGNTLLEHGGQFGEGSDDGTLGGSVGAGPSIDDALVVDPIPGDENQIALQPAQGKDTISISPSVYSNKPENITVLRLTAQQDSGQLDSTENKYFVLNELQLKQDDDVSWNGGSYFIYAHTDDESGITEDTTKGDSPKFTVDDTGALVAASTLSCSEITSGAVIWQSFPFIASSITASRGFYFRDNDDPEDFRKWDQFDADMVLHYKQIYGHYIVPEKCTLKYMAGFVANDGGTDNVIVNIWYCLQANIETDTTSTTFTKAGSDETVSITTSEVGVQFDRDDYDVDLSKGSIIIPTVKTAGAGAASFLGSLTLKFVTR